MVSNNSGWNTTEEGISRLIVWHGNFSLFASLVLIPSGIFVSRYFKDTWSKSTFSKRPIWQLAHTAYMFSAVCCIILGLILALSYSADPEREYTGEEHTHAAIGWAAVIFLIMQIAIGVFLESSSQTLRFCHWFLGLFTSFFLLIICSMSGQMASAQFPYFTSGIISLFCIFAVIMHSIISYILHSGDKEILSESDGSKKFYRAYFPLPIPALEVIPKGGKLRLILFLWFQFGAVAAFIPIFLANSEGFGKYHCGTWSLLQFSCDSEDIIEHPRY